MSEGAYVAIKQGRVRVVPFTGTVHLGDINVEVGQPFGTFMAQGVDDRRQIVWLCNDSALLHYAQHLDAIRQAHAEGQLHEWGLSFVRPWDGSPIAGPLMVVAFEVRSGEHRPLTHDEANRLRDSLVAIGFRPG